MSVFEPPWPPTPRLHIPRKWSLTGVIVWMVMWPFIAHAKFDSGYPSYYGPWGLSASGDRERAKYVRNDCPIPESPLGYQWSKDYKLIKETALR